MLGQVLRLREVSNFPAMEDLHGAAVALVRLQDTYRLNVSTLPSGTFTGVGHAQHGEDHMNSVGVACKYTHQNLDIKVLC